MSVIRHDDSYYVGFENGMKRARSEAERDIALVRATLDHVKAERDQLKEAVEALKTYGRHTADCATLGGRVVADCTCGLRGAISAGNQ